MSEESGIINVKEVVTVELGDRVVRCWCADGFLVADVKRRCRELAEVQSSRDVLVALLAIKGVEKVRVMDRYGGGYEGDISGSKEG
tara:strand:- start:164 stop:421 length:258 start_codon:yes stop_codon:yes gene_type:complete